MNGEETDILCPYCKAKKRPDSKMYMVGNDSYGKRLWCSVCNQHVTRDNLKSILLKGSGVLIGVNLLLSFFGINSIDDL